MALDVERKKLNFLRAQIIDSVFNSGNGHIGGALSCIDIVYMIYKYAIKINDHKQKHRFILSKGHACLAQYCVLAEFKYFPQKELKFFRKSNGLLEGHPEPHIPGVETVSGSLGIGASVGTGMALGLKLKKSKGNVFCLISDGEIQEGIIWETAMFASHNKLGNLIYFLDYNNLQQDGKTNDILNIEPIKKRWEAFGWKVKTIDGHNLKQIRESIKWSKKNENLPKLIIAKTIKGKGVSFMENSLEWHGTSPPSKEQYYACLKELNVRIEDLNY